jgi:N,N'-diacetyllegionaminate synthase
MKIGRIDTDKEILVVAEVGNNHEGRYEAAEEMVRAAARCGAQAVKFQTFKTELFTGPQDPARVARLKSFELSQDQFAALARVARAEGLLFISTPLDLESARFLGGIVDAFKIASGDNDFFPLMDEVASFGKPVLLSTGMADVPMIRAAVERIQGAWKRSGVRSEMAALHCVTSYPVPDHEANLLAIPRLKESIPCTIGYSDHTLGNEAAVLAAALGARVIEKHFTLDKNTSDFRDHKMSADPVELEELVRRIKRVPDYLGSGEKTLRDCEKPFLVPARRSIAAARDLAAGETIALTDLVWLRPAGGLKPGEEARVVGRMALRAIRRGEPISPDIVGGS